MDRNIDGADVQLDNPLDIPVLQVGQGDVVAEEEGHAGIIVLEVEGGAHPLGHLVNKAEDAVVFAAVLLVHQVGFKGQTQLLILLLADMIGFRLAGGSQGIQLQEGVNHIKAIIQDIVYLIAVDAEKELAR